MTVAVRHVVKAGRALITAKEHLPHGEWSRMFRDSDKPVERPIPFGIRTGQMPMALALHPVLSHANHGSLLPASWRALFELSKDR